MWRGTKACSACLLSRQQKWDQLWLCGRYSRVQQRRQLCPFRNREQNFKLESSYFATCFNGLYWKDNVVFSWHSSRQPFRHPSATPGNLRVWKCLVMSPLQASNCTKQAWGWTVWRTLIQFREKSLFIFCSSNVIWMYLNMCALLYYLCLKSFPP